MFRREGRLGLLSILIFLAVIMASGCSEGHESDENLVDQQQQKPNVEENFSKESEEKQDGDESNISKEFAILQEAAQKFVKEPMKLMSTDEVYELITNEEKTTYQLISTRGIEHYNIGHIPGAIQIHRTEFMYDETLNDLEKDKRIVLYCYTANGASYVSVMLNLMGYDAYGMTFGMTEWTSNREVAATEMVPEAEKNYPIETTSNNLGEVRKLHRLETGSTTVEEIVKATGQAFFASGRSRWVSAEDLWNNIQNGVNLSPYVVIDIRTPELYNRGHVPTAINVPYEETMDLNALERLPSNKRLIIVSEDGQAATQVAALYNFLGYDAATLLYGMLTWTDDPEIIGRPLWEGFRDYPYSS